jgi:hypothetical protein
MKARTLLIAAAATLFFAAGEASANGIDPNVIYDNGGPVGFTGFPAVPGIQEVADDFVLTLGSTTIADVHWWGFPELDEDDNFTIRIFADLGGLPEASPTVLDLNVGAVGRNSFNNIFEYWVDIPEITLAADTTYWLSITNDISTNWAWHEGEGTGSGHVFRANDNDSWTFDLSSRDLAFNLTGPSVPEPSGVLLFGVGMLVVGRAIRRR